MTSSAVTAKNIYFKYGFILFYFYVLYSFFKYRFYLNNKMPAGWHKKRSDISDKYLRIVSKKDISDLNLNNVSELNYKSLEKEDIYPLN